MLGCILDPGFVTPENLRVLGFGARLDVRILLFQPSIDTGRRANA
jgi:hypothetical protein